MWICKVMVFAGSSKSAYCVWFTRAVPPVSRNSPARRAERVALDALPAVPHVGGPSERGGRAEDHLPGEPGGAHLRVAEDVAALVHLALELTRHRGGRERVGH